jgi:hypothetical protein
MQDDLDFLTIIVAICVAGYVAIMLDYVAHDELGWSLVQVRRCAIGEALVTSIVALATALARSRRELGGRG